MNARIEHLVTAGNKDPQGPPNHDNNVWLIGDDEAVIVIDPAHDAQAVAARVAGRRVEAILLTHGHWDHCRAAADFASLVDAPLFLNPADEFLWRIEHGGTAVDEVASFETGVTALHHRQTGIPEPIQDGQRFDVAGIALEARHTPGHTPGSTSFVAEALGAVFSGDTLFEGGPGATRWDYSDFGQLIESIENKLFTLPDDTAVHTGHGASTTIGREKPHLQEWIDRGW